MIEIKRYNGHEEFKKTLKLLPNVPTNNEMSEKTGMSKGSISNIMNGKIPPSKKFIDKFKNGFNLVDCDIKYNPTENPDELKDKLISVYEVSLKSAETTIKLLRDKIERLENR